MLRWISSFLCQSLVLIRRYRNVEFDLPEFNTKNVMVGDILKHFGVTALSTAKNLQAADSPGREEHFHQVW
jgi:hypothetical protein